MGSISLDTLVLAKKYTDKVLNGLGTLKGSPCTLKATKENDDGSITVTFAWTDSKGVEETQDVIIPAGPQGTQGEQGEKGTDGVSPTVTITEIDGGHTITITDADGTQSFNVLNGADGYSPSAKVAKENGVVTITITDKTGTTTAEIKENAGAGGAGEENVIEEIKVNGVALAPDENKSVDITVPTVDVDKDYVDTELAKKADTTAIPSLDGYVTEEALEAKGYLTEHQDISGKVDKVKGKSLIADTEIERLKSVKNYDDTEIKTELTKKANSTDIPTKVSELQNDSNYQTDTDVTTTLTPYATKTYVGEQISNADHLKREIVTEIPDASTADEHTIYMLKIESATGNDKYREYLLIDGTMQCTGDTSVDLTDYAKTADIDKKLDNKADKTEIPTFINKTVLDGITAEKVENWDEAVTTKTALDAHTNSIVSSETGVHGIRYYNDVLQVQNEAGEWVDIETDGGAGTIMPKPVSNATIKNKNAQCIITWQDPDDFVLDGVVLADWKGTKLVMSETSFPTNEQDGTLVVDNTEKGKYATDGYTVNNLVNGTTYYFTLFTYSSDGAYNYKQAVHLTGQPSLVKLDPCTNARVVADNMREGRIIVYWDDPEETKEVDGNIATWDKTLLVYKKGNVAPTSITDGSVIEEETRNQYQDYGYEITYLSIGETYSISLFAVSTDGAVSDPISITGIHLYATLFITTDESTLYEKQITATLGSKTVNGIIDDAGQASLNIPWTGETTVTATDSENTATNKVTIEEFNKTYEVELSFLKIVTFANGTDEEIKAMIDAHYANKINIRDYWAVGDKRTVHLSAMSATGVGESHREQDVQMAIAGFDHDDLTTAINGHTKAALTLTQVDCLMDANNASNPVNGENNTENGYMNSTDTNIGGWKDCARRTWCNNVYFNALPSTIKNAVKSVNKKTSAGNKDSTINITSDKVFLLSEIEIYGTDLHGNTGVSFLGEGMPYIYYETTSSRVKQPLWDKTSDSCAVWQRSPNRSNAIYFCSMNLKDLTRGGYYNASAAFGIAPCLCL